jgi:hypothetical protein
MGLMEQASCLTPKVGGTDIEISKSGQYFNNKILNSYNDKKSIRASLMNSFNTNTTTSKKSNNDIISSVYLDIIISIQKTIRGYIARKKFNERIELLGNIIELDSPVNSIKDKDEKAKILSENKGEQLSQNLINSKKIIKYENTLYYLKNFKKYKENRYIKYTDLIYIDKYKNNNLYQGTWTLEKVFHGFGVFYVSGNKYEGFWDFGKLNGECRYFLQNNDYFIGQFKDGQAEGKGKYYHNDGTIYEGEWKNDQPSGKGKEIFIDGSTFDGIFENGVKKKGLFKWNDGSYYDGEIKNNVFDGYGQFHWKEGRDYKGNWKGGKMWGEGVISYVDGATYKGTFSNGKRDGRGKYIWNEFKYYDGEWKNGKQDGKGFFYNKGKGIYANWKEGNIIMHPSNNTKNKSILNVSNRNIINDSLISVNPVNNSGMDNIYCKMKTTQNKYMNINSKLKDITKSKKEELANKNKIYSYNKKKKSPKNQNYSKYHNKSIISNKSKNISIISNTKANKSLMSYTDRGKNFKRNTETKQMNQTDISYLKILKVSTNNKSSKK